MNIVIEPFTLGWVVFNVILLIGIVYLIFHTVRKKKKDDVVSSKKKIVISVLILCFAGYLFIAWPRQVNVELEGIEYTQLDESTSNKISIRIEGYVNNKYIGTRQFNGKIYCEAMDLNGASFNLLFDESNKSYLSIIKEKGKTADYGEIFANKDMNEIVIFQGDSFYVFPSESRKDAEALADKYFLVEYTNHFKNPS